MLIVNLHLFDVSSWLINVTKVLITKPRFIRSFHFNQWCPILRAIFCTLTAAFVEILVHVFFSVVLKTEVLDPTYSCMRVNSLVMERVKTDITCSIPFVEISR